MSRSPGTMCTNLAHQDGDHDKTCMPPPDPNNPELRLLRAIFGLCPDCDDTGEHSHTKEGIKRSRYEVRPLESEIFGEDRYGIWDNYRVRWIRDIDTWDDSTGLSEYDAEVAAEELNTL